MEQHRGANIRLLSVWKGLRIGGMWYDQLLAEPWKQLTGPAANHRQHSRLTRHQQHQRGVATRSSTTIVENYRFDPLAIGRRDSDPDDLNATQTRPCLTSYLAIKAPTKLF